jgi:low density lipoprotein receptor-related protein 5/6
MPNLIIYNYFSNFFLGDPKSRKILVDTDLAWPNGLTLDYENKLLYWMEAKLRYIAVVDWDGRNRRTLFHEENVLQLPFAISVHQSELYWTDWNTK